MLESKSDGYIDFGDYNLCLDSEISLGSNKAKISHYCLLLL